MTSLATALLVGALISLTGCDLPPTTTTQPTPTQAVVAPTTSWTIGSYSFDVTPQPAAGELTVLTDEDGSTHLVTAGQSTNVNPVLLATITVPAELTVQVFPDGSAALWTSEGTLAAGFTPTGAELTATESNLELTGVLGTQLWAHTAAVNNAVWGYNEGGRSLTVTPTAWARTGSQAAATALWVAISTDEEAAAQTMHDQLDCHLLGAREKDTWNLEPWRPEVDSITMLTTRCNPT